MGSEKGLTGSETSAGETWYVVKHGGTRGPVAHVVGDAADYATACGLHLGDVRARIDRGWGVLTRSIDPAVRVCEACRGMRAGDDAPPTADLVARRELLALATSILEAPEVTGNAVEGFAHAVSDYLRAVEGEPTGACDECLGLRVVRDVVDGKSVVIVCPSCGGDGVPTVGEKLKDPLRHFAGLREYDAAVEQNERAELLLGAKKLQALCKRLDDDDRHAIRRTSWDEGDLEFLRMLGGALVEHFGKEEA